MRNPIDVLFGSRVIFHLRRQPAALKRIAERIKPLLMAAVHPDRNHDIGPEEAAEISEAYQRLVSMAPEDLEPLIAEFLRQDRGEALRIQIRDLQQSKVGLELVTRKQEAKIKDLSEELFRERDGRNRSFAAALLWFQSSSTFEPRGLEMLDENAIPRGAIPRGMLHHYRVVVELNDGKFRSYQFDLAGRVRLTVSTRNIRDAREAYLFQNHPLPNSRIKVSSKRDNLILIGSAKRLPKGIVLSRAIEDGWAKPYVEKGMQPVFVSLNRHGVLEIDPLNNPLLDGVGTIVDLIDLDSARRKLVGPGGRGSGNRDNLKTRLAEHKQRKRQKK
ncbi:MAG: hypothetical protein AB200_02715 [Parcubacteria bacterium C7867-005]|nr:MAG: hypothetical protein AB200_02715 [Parcubacteria bacterium C7867-005]